MKNENDIFDFEKPILEIEKMIEKLKGLSSSDDEEIRKKITELEQQCLERKKQIYSSLTPWQIVKIARHPKRPVLQDYISLLFSDFIELHGDRCFADDRALIGGLAKIDGHKVMLIGHNKGKNVEQNVERNFGMARPEGYRKALRLMKLAEKFRLPIISIIDTPAAYPGADAEQRGQAEAIARNLTEMARIKVPIIVAITGEGGSGGALGIGVGDCVLMLSYSIYSVIPPEGCAAILWRDASFAPEAAQNLKITADSLLTLGIIDEIIPEPLGGAHHNYGEIASQLRTYFVKYLKKFSSYSESKLIDKRFEKFSKMGKFIKL